MAVEKKTKTDLDRVFDLYTVPTDQRAAVRRYLRRYPAAVKGLLKAAPLADEVFGDVPRRLEVVTDMESGARDLLVVLASQWDLKEEAELMEPFLHHLFQSLRPDATQRLTFMLDDDDPTGPIL